MSLALPRFEHRLQAEIDDAGLTLGAQAFVWVDGESWAAAIGESGTGGPMASTTMFRLYSAGKPFLAVAIGVLLDQGALTLETAVVDVLEGFGGGGRDAITVRSLLQHTGGTHGLHGTWFAMLADEHRRHLAMTIELPTGWRVGVDAAYSEFVAWHLLGYVVEAVAGRPLPLVLRDTVWAPLGLDHTTLAMDRAEYDRRRPDLGVNCDMSELEPVPMLGERAFSGCSTVNPAWAIYSTAADLGALYVDLLLAGGRPSAVLSSSTARRLREDRRGVLPDRFFGEDLDYALGLMVGLDRWHFGRGPSPAAFGHAGFRGTTMGFADPAHDLACAVVLNGIVDAESAVGYRRPVLVDALYADLAELGAAT